MVCTGYCLARPKESAAGRERRSFPVSKPGILSPLVIAGQVDVFPLERRQVSKRLVGHSLPGLPAR